MRIQLEMHGRAGCASRGYPAAFCPAFLQQREASSAFQGGGCSAWLRSTHCSTTTRWTLRESSSPSTPPLMLTSSFVARPRTSSPSRPRFLRDSRAQRRSSEAPPARGDNSDLTLCSPSVTVPAPTTSVSLNTAAPLRRLGAVLVQGSSRHVATDTTYDDKREILTLNFGATIEAGEAVLGFRWEGDLDAGSLLGGSSRSRMGSETS